MDGRYFVKNVKGLKCLTEKEMNDIFTYYQCKEEKCGKFNINQRGFQWKSVIGSNSRVFNVVENVNVIDVPRLSRRRVSIAISHRNMGRNNRRIDGIGDYYDNMFDNADDEIADFGLS